MEAIPRMLMLSIELKESAERVEFGQALKQHISQHYLEEATRYNEEIRQLDQLRNSVCNVTRDFNGISTLKKYYGQLHLLSTRFPADLITFSWIDTFDEEPYTHTDIHYEQSCVLFNLGTLHSILGAIESRASEEEMKVACTHFQCAAGAYTYLKDKFQCDMSPDISFELMNMYINTMLGQAQECLLEKSMQDNRKSSLVARISMQVVEYYKQALKGLEDSTINSLMGSRRSKWWKKTLQIKVLHFTSISYMYMSNQADEQKKYGDRVAYLTHSQEKHNEAVKMSKGQPESIVEALNFAKDVIVGKLQSARKDNDFVYHDTVPPFESLPEIKGASLVKALSFQPYDESIAGPDIFRKLVPMEAHEASSLYSEEKAKLLRRTGDEIEGKNKELEQYLSAVKLEQLKLPSSETEMLPQVLLEVCAALSVKTEPIKMLVNSMQELSGVVMDVDSTLKEIEQLIQEEEKQEADYQKEFQLKSGKQLGDAKKELSKCRELHATASQSNTELHKAMQSNMADIKLLASPVEVIQASLPSLKDARNEEDDEAEKTMQKLLSKVEEMKTQRQTLEQQLRDQIRDDDITGALVTRTTGTIQEFFKGELKKHDTLISYIEQNLAAQDNILRAMTEANAAYAERRKSMSAVQSKREERIGELISSYTVYDDLIEKSNKGIGFYKKLEGTVSKLLSKTKGVVKANQEERQEKYRKKYPPQRPSVAKPGDVSGLGAQAGPVGQRGPLVPGGMEFAASAPDLTPQKGAKLSDYWKPKTGRTDRSAVYPQVSAGSQPASSLQHAYPATVPGQQGFSTSQHDSSGQNNMVPGSRGASQLDAVPSSPAVYSQANPGSQPPQQIPPAQQQPFTQSPSQSPVHRGREAQVSAMPRHDSFSSPMHMPQEPPGQNQVQPTRGVTPAQLPLLNQQRPHSAKSYVGGVEQRFSTPNLEYPQQPATQIGVNPPPQGGYQVNPQSISQQSQQVAPTPLQQVPGRILSQSDHVSSHQVSVASQPPVKLPPQYGSQQHFAAMAVSIDTSSVLKPPAQGHPPSSYSSAHLPSATNTTASHVPGNISQKQPSNNSMSGGSQPMSVDLRPENQSVLPGSSNAGQQSQMQASNVQMPSQLGNPQHHALAVQGQPYGNWHQQQQLQQQHLHQQQIEQQELYRQQQHPRHINSASSRDTVLNANMAQPVLPGGIPQSGVSRTQQPGQQSQPFHPSYSQEHTVSHQQHQQSYKGPTSHQQTQQNKTQYGYPPVHGNQPSSSQPQLPAESLPQQQHQQRFLPQMNQQQQVNQQPGYPQGEAHVQHPQGFHQTSGVAASQSNPSSFKQQAHQQGHLQGKITQIAGSYAVSSHAQQQAVVQPVISQPYQPSSQQQPQPQTQQGLMQQQFVPEQRMQPPYWQPSQPPHQVPSQSGMRPAYPQQYSPQQPAPQSHQSTPNQQAQPCARNVSHAVPEQAVRPQFQQNLPRPSQQPLQPVNPVQQINQQQTYEQQRLPQPVLQPSKANTKSATDLLSTSPERQNEGLKNVLAPQNTTKTSEPDHPVTNPAADPDSNVSVLASIAVQPVNTESQPLPLQGPSQTVNHASVSSGTLTATSSTTDVLAALKLQPALSVPQPTASAKRNTTLDNSSTTSQTSAFLPVTSSELQEAPKANTGPYSDQESLEKFVEEVERLAMYVEGLNRKMLSGPTVIERLWKELTDYQDRETRQFSIAIARCYSVKNRHPDIMPYDHNRVCLKGARDDYINASYVGDLVCDGPRFIVTQSPLQPSITDFWLMVYEQQASIIVMLLSRPPTATGSTNFVAYWPEDRGAPLKYGDISLSLQSKRTTDYHVERTIHLTHLPTRQMRTITHVQFTAWPEFGVPSSPGVFLQFIGEVQSYHSQQRKSEIPMVVHCSSGIERTGVFCLVYTAVQEISTGHGIVDIPQILKKLRIQRKWMVSEKEQLKFSYDSVLCYAQHALAKRGVATKTLAAASPLDTKIAPSRLNSFDVIMGNDSVDSLISRISKFSMKPSQPQASSGSLGIAEEPAAFEPASEGPGMLEDNPGMLADMPAAKEGNDSSGGVVFQAGADKLCSEDVCRDPQTNTTQGPPSDTGSSAPSGFSSSTSSPAHKTKSLDELQANNLKDFSQTLQNFAAPDVVESSTKQDSALLDDSVAGCEMTESPSASLPSILADLTPQNFSLKDKKGQSKPKTSRAEFLAGKGKLQESVDLVDPSDPFSGLDPMWSMKDKASQPKESS